MAGSVQFVGKDPVMNAFESKGVEAWSIYYYKQLMHKGVGAADLASFLEMLKEGGSNATYTLKVYEGITDPLDIKNKTDFDGSFNFKLNGPNEGVAGTGIYNNNNQEILRRLQAIEEKFEDEQDEEPETIGSAVIDVIKDPDKALKWAGILKDLFNGNPAAPAPPAPMPMPRQIQSPAIVGNAEPKITIENRETRFLNAINTLEEKDPKLVEHLEKLAEIAASKPKAFTNLLSMLELL